MTEISSIIERLNPDIRDPVRLGWKPITQIEHYHVGADAILGAAD